MPDMPLKCPGCGADMRGGRLSSVIDPSAFMLRWVAVYSVRWRERVAGEKPEDAFEGWLCPERCGVFVSVGRR